MTNFNNLRMLQRMIREQIKEKSLLLLFTIVTIGSMQAQTVSGTVLADADQTPLLGATVMEKGTSNGTITDVDGKFTLKLQKAPAVLEISYIGFSTKDIEVSGATLGLVISLSQGAVLEELVITGFGMTKEKKALGYATASVQAADITRVAPTNVASSLYGRAPGVRIAMTPGGATGAANITVRGVNSITGRNQPLIVLDGVPIRDGEVRNNDYWGDQRLRGSGLNEINPEDIESVTVLKGASAAALYGSEAVNGVLLITSKTGSKDKKGFKIDFVTNYTVDRVAYTPIFQNVRANGVPGPHVANLGTDAEGFIYYDTDGDGVKETRGLPSASINFGPRFDGKPIMAFDGVIRPYEAQVNNWKNLFQDAQNSNVNLSISQSNDKGSMRFSVTRQDNEGVSLNSASSRNIANLNTTYNFSKVLRTDLMINYINQKVNNRPYSIDRLMNNFTGMMTRFENGDWYKNIYQTSQGYRFVTGASGQSLTPNENIIYNGFKGDVADYVWRVNKHKLEETSHRMIGSLTNTFQILPELKLRARISTDLTSLNAQNSQASERPLIFGNSGFYSIQNQQFSILYGDVFLDYTKSLTKDINLTLRTGYTANKETNSSVSRSTNGGLSTENRFDVSASVNTPGGGQSRSSRVIDAIVGTANLDYKGFLFVEGTIRRDRTSTMHPDNNDFIYPSVNSAFIFSDAGIDLPSFISFGKLRASWGIVGNYPDVYASNIAYNQNTLGVQTPGGNSVLFTTLPTSFGNDGIRPERKHEYEIGLEAKFFNNKIGLDIAYYNAQIRDQILGLTLPISTGGGSILSNVGTLRNKGIEVGLQTTPVTSGKFRWDLIVNYAWNKNVVEKLANNATELLHADFDGQAAQLKSVVGQPMGDFYTHPIELSTSGQPIIQANGLYKLSPTVWQKSGNTQPFGVGGIINSFTFGNLTLDANIDFRLGGVVMPTAINWMMGRGLLEESTQFMDKESGGISYYVNKDGKGVKTDAAQGPAGEKVYNDGMLLEGVTVEGQPNVNVVSQAFYFWNTYNWGGPQYSSSRYDLYVEKATYVKMREMALGFNLPSSLTKKIGASKVNISVFGRNLFFLHRKLRHIDPEVLTAGSRWSQTVSNAGTNPSTRTVGLMLRTSF